MKPKLIAILSLYLLVSLYVAATQADVIRVAVASNFSVPMKSIARDFEDQTGHQLILSYGSSGKFFAQIMNGAPYDVFLSADAVKPVKLEQQKRTVDGSRFTYALGTLVLWGKNIPLEQLGPETLQREDVRKIAIANPRLAPYGAAAQEVLSRLSVYPELRSRLVMGENISQAYQFVDTGNAELGLVALSQISGREKVGYWIVPSDMHKPIEQQAVLLKSGNQQAALALMQYLRSSRSREIIQQYGYSLPAG